MTLGSKYRIERVPSPRFVTGEVPGDRALTKWFGEEGWGWAVPLMYQVLAAPRSYRPFPSKPAIDAGPGEDTSFGYWSALLHLLIYSFGWARPDLGLRWWYDADRPIDDSRFQLISETWQSDGRLDEFAAWLWATPILSSASQLEELAGRPVTDRPVRVDRTWVKAVTGAIEPGVSSPAPVGGLDPLHLSAHCIWPLAEPTSKPKLVRSSRSQAEASLIVDSMVGWYRALATADLPDLGNRSWRVDVIATPVGHLGTFRRSRETGLWFAGKHRYHIQGN